MRHMHCDDDSVLIRLERGEDVIQSLLSFLDVEGISMGSFTGLGALSRAVLGHYSLSSKQYTYRTFEEELEVASMVGNVAIMNGKPIIHAHAVVCGRDFAAYGGHLQEATVAATIEISLHVSSCIVERKYEEEIGLNLLQI